MCRGYVDKKLPKCLAVKLSTRENYLLAVVVHSYWLVFSVMARYPQFLYSVQR